MWQCMGNGVQFGQRTLVRDMVCLIAISNRSCRVYDRLVALLSAMSRTLGYRFSEEELRRID